VNGPKHPGAVGLPPIDVKPIVPPTPTTKKEFPGTSYDFRYAPTRNPNDDDSHTPNPPPHTGLGASTYINHRFPRAWRCWSAC